MAVGSGVASAADDVRSLLYAGIDTFTFAAYDGVHPSAPETVTVTITPVPDAPRFPDDDSAASAASRAARFPR